MKTPPTTQEELIDDWHRRAREAQFAHYEAIRPLERADRLLGVPAVILSAILAASIFATLEHSAQVEWRVLAGVVSAAAAVLSGLQTFLRFRERAEKHRSAGGQYGAIRRELEQARAAGPPYDAGFITSIRERFDSVSTSAPEIPTSVWKRTEARLAARGAADGGPK